MGNSKSDEATMYFDYLILACPLTPDIFKQLGLKRTEGEEIFSKIIVNPYCMTTYWVNGLDMPQPIAPVLPLTQPGKPWAVAQQFKRSEIYFTQFYTRPKPLQKKDGLDRDNKSAQTKQYWDQIGNPAETEEDWDKIEQEVKAEVKKLVDQLGGTIDKTKSHWHSYDRFTYFQHVTPEEIGDRYYEKLADLQSKNNTFYVGGVTDFELVEPIVQHSKYLVEKHFPGADLRWWENPEHKECGLHQRDAGLHEQ